MNLRGISVHNSPFVQFTLSFTPSLLVIHYKEKKHSYLIFFSLGGEAMGRKIQITGIFFGNLLNIIN
jgi:hypothetical protein